MSVTDEKEFKSLAKTLVRKVIKQHPRKEDGLPIAHSRAKADKRIMAAFDSVLAQCLASIWDEVSYFDRRDLKNSARLPAITSGDLERNGSHWKYAADCATVDILRSWIVGGIPIGERTGEELIPFAEDNERSSEGHLKIARYYRAIHATVGARKIGSVLNNKKMQAILRQAEAMSVVPAADQVIADTHNRVVRPPAPSKSKRSAPALAAAGA